MTSPTSTSSLVLGTVQLGVPYGIANRTGRPDADAATRLVEAAWQGGMREFDTAQAYGDSERTLGQALRRLGIAGEARVISKFAPDLDHLDRAALVASVERSLERLGVDRLEGIMLHREEQLDLWPRGLGETLTEIVAGGLARRAGVSVYTPARAMAALDTDGIEMIQAPTSILDRRFADAGMFGRARDLGKRVYVRSVFLQGLALMAPADIPEGLAAARPVVERLDALAARLGLSRRDLALAAARDIAGGDARIVVGAETAEQVRQNIASWSHGATADLARIAAEAIGPVDEALLNPATWPKQVTA